MPVMKKYRVLIDGHNFLIRVGDKSRKHGFFTARFVEAREREEAENKAIETLRNDASLSAIVQNEESDPPVMFVEEIEELKSFGEFQVPGSGFVWYPEGADAD